jgi:hypothetical protein
MTRNDQLLKLLYDAFPHGSEQLNQAMENIRGELTPELAAQASERYKAAIERQDAPGAFAASTIAFRILNLLGRREDAFNALVDRFYVRFMLAQTEKDYADIRTELREVLAGYSYGQGSPDTGLRARVLSADCAFFACESVAEDTAKKRWLQAALESLQDGVQFLTETRTSLLILQFSCTTVAVYQVCVSKGWVGEPWAASRLAALTAVMDRATPAKLIFPGDDAKTASIDAARAQMSYLYNSSYTREETTGQKVSGLFGRKQG